MKKTNDSVSYGDLIWIFTKVGSLAFGGWSATALLLESELVDRRGLLSANDVHGSVTYSQILPGGTQTAIVSGVGYKLRGLKGSILATCFYLLPSIIMITVFSVVYFHYLRHTELTSHLSLVRAALGGIIFSNSYRLAKRHAGKSLLWLFILTAFLTKLFLGLNSVLIILIYAAAGLTISRFSTNRQTHAP